MDKSELKILETVQQYGIQINSRGWCKCPFHNDSKPSMHINTDKNRAFCNPCGIGLDPIGFMMKYENISFNDLIKRIEGDEPLDKKIIAARKRIQDLDKRNQKLIERAIDVFEDYIFMLETYKECEPFSKEFIIYCHNWDYVNFIYDDFRIHFGEWKDNKYIETRMLTLSWINANMKLLKRMAKGEPILGSELIAE